ncbi:EpsG family protein [Scandinavium manionii]|uniref:EpsG family protein n=1 Tax=Scandinavium manionii TaxID=2926520 RepID=UPI002165E29E|nr:EpsG family protein [Scandinavium manionii]MCS2150039.1 EpsG family protein [Scandinavium manionii]
MLYIFLLLASLAFCSVQYVKSAKPLGIYFLYSTLFMLFLFSALRYGVGTDYKNYVKIYHEINSSIGTDANIEFAFYNIVKFCDYIGADVELMFAIMSAIIIIVFFSAREMRTIWGVFAFICILYLPSFSLIRQSAAIGFVCVASFAIINNRVKYAFALTVIGCLFHMSAILFILVILCRRIKIGIGLGFVTILTIYVLLSKFNLAQLVLDNEFFRESRYGVYSDSGMFAKQTEMGTGLGVLLKLLPSFIFLLLSRGYKRSDDKNIDALNILNCLNYIYIIAILFSIQIHIFNRVVDLFMFVPAVTFVSLNRLGLTRDNEKIWRLIFSILIFLNFVLMIYSNPSTAFGGLGINPYQSILSAH